MDFLTQQSPLAGARSQRACSVGAIVLVLLATLIQLSCESPPSAPEAAENPAPPLQLANDLLGRWVGTIAVEEEHQTVVLEIRSALPHLHGLALDYQMNGGLTREKGIARVEYEEDEKLFSICFPGNVCGWIIPQSPAGYRLASHLTGPPELIWELRRQEDNEAVRP